MTSTISAHVDHDHGLIDDGYEQFLATIKLPEGPLFTTHSEGLFDVFLSFIPEEKRQVYTCNACRRFIERYGGLVTIDENGRTHPALWSLDVPELFRQPVAAMISALDLAPVTGVFLTSSETLGTPVTGAWHHMATNVVNVYHNGVLSADQKVAELHEDFGVLERSLRDFNMDVAELAGQVVESDALYRSEKVEGVAKWFYALHTAIKQNRGRRGNLIWRAVATAPIGYAHVRNTMIGTLLSDIADGLAFDDVARRFATKMHPLQYQRPQAAPTAGNVAQAEKLVEKLGIRNSLKRRFARLEEIQTLWMPRRGHATKPTDGVFSKVEIKVKGQRGGAKQSLDLPPRVMTWSKFEREILPEASQIEFLVPHHANFCAIVTAEDPNAPPILQWDRADKRNPFSWYCYSSMPPAHSWGLTVSDWVEVTGVCLKPSMWNDGNFSHMGRGLVFVLKGAKDQRAGTAGLGLFPEILKSELHQIRATIEGYSRDGVISGIDESSANGIALFEVARQQWDYTFRVTVGGVSSLYRLDRWD